jgi:hypothetical protein
MVGKSDKSDKSDKSGKSGKSGKVKISTNMKKCSRCKYFKIVDRFRSKKPMNTISMTCDVCRIKNSARYIARDQSRKFGIFKILESEKISKPSVYLVYINQHKKCYVCNHLLTIYRAYINKYDQGKCYYNNIFLSCYSCYRLNDNDMDAFEFKEMIYETNHQVN